MAYSAESIQNVEVSKKIAPELSPFEQLELMEKYTAVFDENLSKSKEEREVNCLSVLLPTLLRSIEPGDLIAGRLDFLPIGFGCVTSLGGVGHYCVFRKLKAFKEQLPDTDQYRVDKLYDYWLSHDLKTKYCKTELKEDVIGMFVDFNAPMIATARLSGMMLDYHALMEMGINGLSEKIQKCRRENGDNEFYRASQKCIGIFKSCCDALIDKLINEKIKIEDILADEIPYSGIISKYEKSGSDDILECEIPDQVDISKNKRNEGYNILPEKEADSEAVSEIKRLKNRLSDVERMISDLRKIRTDRPETFTQALQLFWLYALLSGVINYGRMDDVLGDFLATDLKAGRITKEYAFRVIKSLWTLIENRRTTVNGRIIVGGRGRRNPENADIFVRLALRVAASVRYVEPQFTLRFDKDTPEDIMNMALDTIGAGATYPVLYNDDVNIPAIAGAMGIGEKAAEQYVAYGCGEYVIQGQSVSTSNTNVNLLKILEIAMNNGIDPMDGKDKSDGVYLKPVEKIESFDELFAQYKNLTDHYLDLSVQCQIRSYEIMNEEVSFLFTSMLMNDCLERGKALLDGGVRYLGGTNEFYGLINTSDSLAAIKKCVFEDKICSLAELRDAVNANFGIDAASINNDGNIIAVRDKLVRDKLSMAQLRKALWNAPKYGNDDEYADSLAVAVYEHSAKGNRDRGMEAGLKYFLAVISNNQQNTEWGRLTAASYDGRYKGKFMNPANNPQGGANKEGITAMLNSLVKLDPKLHGGSVQNMRFTPALFNKRRDVVKSLLKVYFENGGCQAMITILDQGTLRDAQEHPENYQNLIVRVSGFSARFIDLERDVQEELISRELYG